MDIQVDVHKYTYCEDEGAWIYPCPYQKNARLLYPHCSKTSWWSSIFDNLRSLQCPFGTQQNYWRVAIEQSGWIAGKCDSRRTDLITLVKVKQLLLHCHEKRLLAMSTRLDLRRFSLIWNQFVEMNQWTDKINEKMFNFHRRVRSIGRTSPSFQHSLNWTLLKHWHNNDNSFPIRLTASIILFAADWKPSLPEDAEKASSTNKKANETNLLEIPINLQLTRQDHQENWTFVKPSDNQASVAFVRSVTQSEQHWQFLQLIHVPFPHLSSVSITVWFAGHIRIWWCWWSSMTLQQISPLNK